MNLRQKIKAAAEFDEQEAWRRCGYDDEREPGVREIIGGARGENLALAPLIESLIEITETLEFYADGAMWQGKEEPSVMATDYGNMARAALEKLHDVMESPNFDQALKELGG